MALLALLALLGCQAAGRAQTAAPAGTAASARFATTAELVADPQVAALVEQLAAPAVVQTQAVGALRAPGDGFVLFQQLKAAASGTQLLALLRHQSPVVRAYVVRYFVGSSDADQAAVLSLLDDDTLVKMEVGCHFERHRMCKLVLEQLRPGRAQDRLLQVAREAGNACRLLVLKPLGVLKRPEVRPIAESLLLDSDPAAVVAALGALAKLGASESAERVRALGASKEPGVRQAVAEALAAWPSPESAAVLRRLMDDADERVRGAAAKSYLRLPARDLQQVHARWHTEEKSVRLYIELGLAMDGRPDALALLRRLLLPASKVAEDFWPALGRRAYYGEFPSPAFIELVRRLRPLGAAPVVRRDADDFLKEWQSAIKDPAAAFR